jgi:hypothetical protein
VYHAARLIPKLHVLLKISIIQKVHHVIRANSIGFNALSKCGLCLESIIAIPSNSICNISLGSDMGTGSGNPFIWTK